MGSVSFAIGLSWWNYQYYQQYLKHRKQLIKDHATVKAILQSRSMSAAPQRLTHSNTTEEIKGLYRFVSLMLLYNDEGHSRLRQAYPKLNSKKSVQNEYGAFITKAVDSLLSKVLIVGNQSVRYVINNSSHLLSLFFQVEGNPTIDIMKDVAVHLPWVVISQIAGYEHVLLSKF